MSNFASNDNMTAIFTAAGEKIGERAKIFPGTKAEWDALPLSEKIKYDYVAFAGDSQSGIVDDVPTEDSENLVKSGGVYDSLATKANLTQISNPNLLDNPWFTVNQRGITTDTQAEGTNRYTVDRWYARGIPTVTVNADGSITLDNSEGTSIHTFMLIGEATRFNQVKRRTVTYSIDAVASDSGCNFTSYQAQQSQSTFFAKAIPTNREIVSKTFVLGNIDATSKWEMFNINVAAGTTVTIYSVKLELGSVSTLAMDTAPNYATELLKCQRYFYRLKSTGGNDWIAFGKAWTSSAVNVIIPIPSMRALPTASVSDMTKLLVAKGSSTLDPHRISQILAGYYKEFGSSIAMTLTLADSTATNGDNYVLKADAPVNIDFSADL